MTIDNDKPTVAVLGTGIIGAPIARNLSRAGYPVAAWNRTADKAKPLTDDGVRVETDVAAAVAGATIVFTVVKDAAAVLEILAAAGESLAAGTILVQISTVGVAGIGAIAAAAATRSLELVDAPVQGTKGPAENGQLVVLASAAPALRDRVTPLFDVIGKATVWVSQTPGEASKLKLVVNTLIGAITHGVAESVRLARALDLDPRVFQDAVAGGPLESAFGTIKTEAILAGNFAPNFSVDNAVKDSRLIAEAAEATGVWLPQAEAGLRRYLAAAAAGHAEADMAATYFADRPTEV
ncbi:NAD(P)-dependent oxidoreductase [Nocardia takedensis]